MSDATAGQPRQRRPTGRNRGEIAVLVGDVLESGREVVVGAEASQHLDPGAVGYCKVRANRGAAGIDDETIEQFEADLKGNLYKLWNRM